MSFMTPIFSGLTSWLNAVRGANASAEAPISNCRRSIASLPAARRSPSFRRKRQRSGHRDRTAFAGQSGAARCFRLLYRIILSIQGGANRRDGPIFLQITGSCAGPGHGVEGGGRPCRDGWKRQDMTASRLIATYRIRARADAIEERARAIAIEQSVEAPLAAIRDEEILSHIV